MRIPARIIEHPIESLIASALLLGLLFGAGDVGRDNAAAAQAARSALPAAMPVKNL
jgi:hypothetical protein